MLIPNMSETMAQNILQSGFGSFQSLSTAKVEEIMTGSPQTIFSSSLAVEASGLMNRKAITNLFVLDETTKELVGLLRLHDCLREGLA